MTGHDDARYAVIRGLRHAQSAHSEGRLSEIGSGWDTAASFDYSDPNLSIALSFWEGWADSAAHGWLYYGELHADDWPRMAREVLDALEAGEPISNATVLSHFSAHRVHTVAGFGRARWFPRRHRVIAFLLATLLIAPALLIITFGAWMLAHRAGASHLVMIVVGIVALPSVAAAMVRPLTKSLERRLIHSAARAQDNQHRGSQPR
jgi:hypothetical protein